jgi:neutral ceramidase
MPGFDYQFKQGTREGQESVFWDLVRDVITTPSEEMTECQAPKAILLAVGEMNLPYQWTPDLMATQLFKIGDVVIAGFPGELTTMSGRRLRDAITKAFADNGQEVKVTLTGLANTYSHYIATYEEYQVQRYEGGSTLYGPHTLQAYIQQYVYLANNMAKQTRVAPGPVFPNLLKKEITVKPGVIEDSPKIGHKFGFNLNNVDNYHKFYTNDCLLQGMC